MVIERGFANPVARLASAAADHLLVAFTCCMELQSMKVGADAETNLLVSAAQSGMAEHCIHPVVVPLG
jgi:hypothetical protein